ncbi:PREDICTED: probable serine/threonine-protein kinase mps1 [Amphimedon queenslandica]|nr:PREDICTED: probable serine/threonine-protein kinase mps1 [Amphimedon queenslandica]|eukprot:XP_019853341.1 PREDICTED: probable serine/threonine-protein kinase mps1 [Amphimedon queenslandica]
MEVYHLPTSRWEQKPTTGNPPLGILGYVSAAIGNEIFYFGGGCNHDSCYHNSLYSFNVDTFTWRELSPTTPHHGPMIKAHCSMVAFQLNGKDYLAVIGGQGPSSNNTPTQPNAQYNSKGMAPGLKRTNEIHYYKLSSGKWSSPNVTGDRPPPTSYFTLTSITNDCAILFGGATPNGSSNNTYIVNFSHTSVNFSNLGVSVQKPKKQYAHSSVFINSKLGPHLLVVGGYSKDDCWLLDVNKRRWKQLSNLPTRVTDRRCHSMSVWSITPTIDWIIVFGGGSRYKDTAVIELRYIDNNWSVSEIPLTPLDQYQEKLRERRREWEASQPVQPHHHQNKERETKLPTQQLQEKGRELQKDRREIDRLTRLLQERERELKEERIEKEQVRTRLQEQLESRERESQEREQQLQREIERAQEEKNQILRQQERESEEREQQLQTQLQQEVQGREREVQQALNLQQQLQQEVQEGREREQNLQQQLQETERQLQQQLRERDEHELRERESSWIVSRNDIIMTGRVLGRGGWAEVRVASFHGLEVAAKVLHDTIISEYNLSLFSRDINIASKIRHPNLLQFIGATTEGNPIILTELMPTSLRKELETGGLAYHAVLDISLDVAFALNYLHLFKPHPILHRDVSSANVLLQSIGHGWRAKLSDYGQPFIDRTTNPGNPVYSAPEAANPREHSPAMDVFSYGVLLVEMVSRRIPLPDERRALIDGIRRASFRSLVQCCLIVEYRQRPTMNDIITELKETIY